MPDETVWLLAKSGPTAGARYPLKEGATRIGRAPENDIVLGGLGCETVSGSHCEVVRDGAGWRVRDLGSTNGTWVNGERVDEAEVTAPAQIRLGASGPEFSIVTDAAAPAGLDQTIEVKALPAQPTRTDPHDELLSSAVMRARHMRAHGAGGETMTIMREVIDHALSYTRRRFRILGYSLLIALVIVSGVAMWQITMLNREKETIDARIRELETELQKASDTARADELISELDTYQNQARNLRQNLLLRISGASDEADLITRELRTVMAELGAEVYAIPPEFVERVNYYINENQGAQRPLIERALTESHADLQKMRRILQEEQLPPDLAYIPVVESAVSAGQASAAGAVGLWQFTAPTARAYGLRVDGEVDERKDLVKSTRASCKYLRDLILDFGAGTSVLLALAAYNSGPSKVKQAVANTVRDPIKQRDFWYLYRARALPRETREFVPKVFAAILIGRNPKHFGF